tara:strand:- start:282 stop:890 length:609 start_codon:yes stop_codon:yes gene_type:complete
MKVKDAVKITGSMTRTKKMPGLSYSLPAWECQVGSKLRTVKGSVCSGCYALKGNYTRYPAIKAAQYYRLQSLRDPQWIPAMVAQIKRQKFFRWHDAGDLQGVWHLKNIMEVCTLTPSVKHWLPTREVKYTSLMDPDIIPSNLKIIISDHMIDQATPVKSWPYTSGVTTKQDATCPAPSQGGKCGDCRACWDRGVARVVYGKH